jgi:DNA mismatch repair protein MutS2
MQTMNAKLKAKLISYQELFDHNQRMIVLGNKVNELAERYFSNNKKRPLISELLRVSGNRKRQTQA